MSTSSATEAARQRNGQFGTQVRSELDPANAGLDVPEAPLPTWEEALAHAEVLREQGVKVRIDERYRVIEIRGDNGKRHDPADISHWTTFYPDGTPMTICHYTNGELHDPADGTPASRGFYPDGTPKVVEHWTNGELVSQCFYSDGTPEWISHWTNGKRHDPAGGTPAYQCFYSDGTPKWIEHWTDGKLVSEESFPPPTGEV